MNKKEEVVQKNKIANNDAAVQGGDHCNLSQHVVNKGMEAVGKTVNALEQEKPGTLRKLAGIASLAVSVGGFSAGIYLLTT